MIAQCNSARPTRPPSDGVALVARHVRAQLPDQLAGDRRPAGCGRPPRTACPPARHLSRTARLSRRSFWAATTAGPRLRRGSAHTRPSDLPELVRPDSARPTRACSTRSSARRPETSATAANRAASGPSSSTTPAGMAASSRHDRRQRAVEVQAEGRLAPVPPAGRRGRRARAASSVVIAGASGRIRGGRRGRAGWSRPGCGPGLGGLRRTELI